MATRTDGMTTVDLTPHPATALSPAGRIGVEIARLGEVGLTLRYRAYGELKRIAVLDEASFDRADHLWRHTCFEAFLRAEGETGYLELNFALTGQWAAYRFTGYREGMAKANVAPAIVQAPLGLDPLELEVEIDLGRMARPDLPAPVWQVALAAVIEDIDGGMSYWALAHPSDKPDFHHPDSFVLTLPPPEPA